MKDQATRSNRIRKSLLLIGIMFFLVIGIIYIYTSWRSYKQQETREAVGQVEAACAFIDSDLVRDLLGNADNIDLPAYKALKRDLTELANQNPELEFAYLLSLNDGRLYFLVDSEPPESENYSPPGQEYYEASEQYMLPFFNGESLLTQPTTDRWGFWISALVPIKDSKTGEVIAVLGIDYPAEIWKAEINGHVVQSVVIVVCIILLLMVVYRLYGNIMKIGALSTRLRENESLFRSVFEQAPMGIALVRNNNVITEINSEYQRILGRTKDEILSLNWEEITHPDDLHNDLMLFEQFKAGEISGYSMEKRYFKPDGSLVWVYMVITGISEINEELGNGSHLCIIMDINDRKLTEESLRESERSKDVLLSHIPGIAYRCNYDTNWTMRYLSAGCYDLTGYKPEELINNNKLSFSDIICDEYHQKLWDEWMLIIETKSNFFYEYEIMTASGELKWVMEMGQPVLNKHGEVEALEGIILDITVPKQAMAKIQHMADHDFLTGLYNRKYFEEAKLNIEKHPIIPTTVIMADINGMRLINDAFGQAAGDDLIIKTAEIIEKCCHEGYILARTGGDEFSILMPNTDIEAADIFVKYIRKECEAFNATLKNQGVIINLSIGYGLKQTAEQSIESAFKEAEDYLYRNKILERKSHHNAILSSIMATMYARSNETELHAERLMKLSKIIGAKLNLPQNSFVDLELLSILHDIGKMGIDDHILKKAGPLNNDEWIEMKKHPEIGYRIALSVPDFERVAEYVLCHHERWDGNGYPQGLKEEEIPLLSRIIAVVDAYDAMTEDRVYRKAMTHSDALVEIKKHAGTQFDPFIADLFISSIQE